MYAIAALNAFQRDISIPVMVKAQIAVTDPSWVFQSRSGLKTKIADRFCRKNRDPVAK
jgi:hypothetical protein